MAAGRGRPRLPDEPYVPPSRAEVRAGLVLTCRACGLERRTSEFTEAQRRSSWPQCRTCARAVDRKRRARRGGEYVRAKNLKQFYGLSPDDVRGMRARQQNRCPICVEELGPDDETAIDHCYETGLVRGLLHPMCNTGLGSFRDDPERLRRAADYLEDARHRLGDDTARFIPLGRLGRRPGT
jgi:hypothetical protein